MSNKRWTLESQLFTWRDWNEIDVGDFEFYDVELLVPIGDFPAGTKFGSANINMSSSSIELFRFGPKDDSGFAPETEHYKFAISLSIGEKIEDGD